MKEKFDAYVLWTLAFARCLKLHNLKKPNQAPEVNTLVDNYRNIFFNTIKADRLVLETPVASLWNTNKIEKSRYSLSHTR